MRVTLWITTAIHLDTLNQRFDPFDDFDCLCVMRELARMRKEHAATEERLKRMKKERGWVD